MRVILSVINDLTIDQRVHKVCQTLTEEGFNVLLVGRKKKSSIPLSPRDYSTHRMSLIFEKGKFFYLEYNLRLFFFLLFRKADILTANDLDTLLPNYLISRIKGARLIYDSHEYFTEMPELVERPATQKVWLKLEQWLFTKAKYISTVNDSLADIYKSKYQRDLVVVRNLPFISNVLPVPASEKRNVVIYQGNVNLSRGIEIMLYALQLLDNVEFWVVGPGDLLEEMKKLSVELKVSTKVKFFGQIPFHELASITTQAKIGLSIEQPVGLNSTLCLPNKLMDYIQCGVPVIVAPLPEIKKIMDKYQVGLMLELCSPAELAALINQLLYNEQLYDQLRSNCLTAAKDLNWQKERIHLLKMYN